MSETGIYVICQYGIKIDLSDKKVSLREANKANMKRADEPAWTYVRILKLPGLIYISVQFTVKQTKKKKAHDETHPTETCSNNNIFKPGKLFHE